MTKRFRQAHSRTARRYLLATLAVASAFVLTGCFQEGRSQPETTRPPALVSCPSLSIDPLPKGFELVKRELASVDGTHMGTVQHYRRGQQSFALYIGPDLYDSLEDLDLVGRRVRAAEYVFVLSQTDVNPPLRIAVLEKPGLDEPCADAGILTGNLSTAAVVDLLDGFRIEQSP